jgi:signal transduction histidine kinase
MPTVVHREPIDQLTIKAALLVGFGVTFGIWLIAGYYFTTRIGDVERRAAAINTRYMQAQELLSTVRAQVLLGSVYVRDALLDPNPAPAEYRRQLEATYGAINQALEHYVPVLDSSAEREQVGRLQHEVDDFRSTLLQVLSTDSTRWPIDARTLIRTQIMPKRELVIRVSEEVQALNRSAFVEQQRQIAEIHSVSQRRLWESLGLALAASFGIALLVGVYAGRLETRIRRQRVRDAQNASELHHLSAKLITAQEEERRSLARELHDEVGQVLTAIKVELAVAQRAIEAGGGAAHLLDDARAITDSALTTVRDLSHLLHPALLDDLGLRAAVEWHVRGFGRRYDIRTEVLHDRMDERLAPEIEACAYRIIQEALTNVARHARASSCQVYLQRLPNTVLITVEDNGMGFDHTERERAGGPASLGLIGIRERASLVRGTVRLESAPGKGTRLTVELPARLRAPAEDPQTAEPCPPVIEPHARAGTNG